MKIKRLHIRNYKSLVDLEIIEPNPFTVFAGPNASGKSNIFEALEFGNYLFKYGNEFAVNLFEGKDRIISFKYIGEDIIVSIGFGDYDYNVSSPIKHSNDAPGVSVYANDLNVSITELKKSVPNPDEVNQFRNNFNRLFIGNEKIKKILIGSDLKLNQDGTNLEKVLKRIIDNNENAGELNEILKILIPGLDKISIHFDRVSGDDTLLIFEEGMNEPFPKSLISDGTYNILCLLTALYQYDEPQFLCIEEPENGLNPYVIKSMVELFRKQCEEKGHYIWLNTHSQTLVNALKPEELILVDKVNGETKIKQFPKDYPLHGLQLDEAWLSNALGGGVPW